VAVGKSVTVFGIFMDFTPVTGVTANRLVETPAGKSNWTLTPPQASTPQRNICMHAGK
jgi:hypothetical protein